MERATKNTFSHVAAEMLSKATRLAEPTRVKKQWLIGMANETLADRPIAQITAAELLTVLRAVEAKGNLETATRLRSVMSQVFRYGIATTVAEQDPTSGLRGALKPPKVTHQGAVTDRMGAAALMRAVWCHDGLPDTRAALQLLALLYPRPGELRAARWAEFDLDRAEWMIPAERTKMRRAHRKPLPAAALAILTECRARRTGSGLVFPAANGTARTMSENTLNMALRRLGYRVGEATSHGFRATASSLLNESGRWSPDAIEAELGHSDQDAVRRAYHRAMYWDERRAMAEWWAAEVEALRSTALEAAA